MHVIAGYDCVFLSKAERNAERRRRRRAAQEETDMSRQIDVDLLDGDSIEVNHFEEEILQPSVQAITPPPPAPTSSAVIVRHESEEE